MSLVATPDMDAREVAARTERGETLLCPRCRSPLRPVPEGFKPGGRLHGIQCPRDPRHYLIVMDDAVLMAEMRALMAGRPPGGMDGGTDDGTGGDGGGVTG